MAPAPCVRFHKLTSSVGPPRVKALGETIPTMARSFMRRRRTDGQDALSAGMVAHKQTAACLMTAARAVEPGDARS